MEGSSDDGNGEEKVNEDEEEEMGEETSDNLTIEDIKAMKLVRLFMIIRSILFVCLVIFRKIGNLIMMSPLEAYG